MGYRRKGGAEEFHDYLSAQREGGGVGFVDFELDSNGWFDEVCGEIYFFFGEIYRKEWMVGLKFQSSTFIYVSLQGCKVRSGNPFFLFG